MQTKNGNNWYWLNTQITSLLTHIQPQEWLLVYYLQDEQITKVCCSLQMQEWESSQLQHANWHFSSLQI